MSYETSLIDPKHPNTSCFKKFLSIFLIVYCFTLTVIICVMMTDSKLIQLNTISESDEYLQNHATEIMETAWNTFRIRYNKTYENQEAEEVAKLTFYKSMYYINKHNLKFAKNESTFEIGINQFSDKSEEEFNRDHTGFGIRPNNKHF